MITEESDNSKTGGKIELSSHRKGSIDQTASTSDETLTCCHLTACVIWLTKFKLNLQRGEGKLGEVSHLHSHM